MGTNILPLIIGKAKSEIFLLPKMANRHGLIAGTTGTEKTVTLRVLAEQFSKIGVPCFLADIKGAISGLAFPGEGNPKVVERINKLRRKDFSFEGYPVIFWDVFAEQGHLILTTISEMGPLLLSRILNLNDIQSGVLTLVFKNADDNGLLLLDLLFEDIPKALEEKIEQVVRLIRSKGVGIYFVTQNTLDLPEMVLGQLGNRVQHALRAFICPPHSRLQPITPEERAQLIRSSLIYGHYERTIDRESAYEKLKAKAEQMKTVAQEEMIQKRRPAEPKSQTEQLLQAAAKSAAHVIGSQLGRQIIQGILGFILGSGKKW